jgi:hypothetical protein
MFQLTVKETKALRFHFGTSKGRGGRRYRPYVFTEQGVAMLSSILNSDRAVLANIAIIRTFVKLRKILESHSDLSRKLAELEKRYDHQFKVVFDAIRQLMTIPAPKPKPIGFRARTSEK